MEDESIEVAKLRAVLEILPDLRDAVAGYSLLQEHCGITAMGLTPDKLEVLYVKVKELIAEIEQKDKD